MSRYKQIVYPQIRILSAIVACVAALALWRVDFFMLVTGVDGLLLVGVFSAFLFGVAMQFWNLLSLRSEYACLEAISAGALHEHDAYAPARSAAPRLLTSSMRGDLTRAFTSDEGVSASGLDVRLTTELRGRIAEKIARAHHVARLVALIGLSGGVAGLIAAVGAMGPSLQDVAGSVCVALLGLIGWFILGVMTAVSSRADEAFAHDFQTWVTKLARADSERRAAAAAPLGADPKGVRDLTELVRASVASSAALTKKFDTLAGGLEAVHRDHARTRSEQTALAARLDRALEVQGELIDHVRKNSEVHEAPLARMSAVIERLEERLIREHARARELMAQQNRALVVQAEQAAQRSALATSHLGEQTRALREAMEGLGSVLTSDPEGKRAPAAAADASSGVSPQADARTAGAPSDDPAADTPPIRLDDLPPHLTESISATPSRLPEKADYEAHARVELENAMRVALRDHGGFEVDAVASFEDTLDEATLAFDRRSDDRRLLERRKTDRSPALAPAADRRASDRRHAERRQEDRLSGADLPSDAGASPRAEPEWVIEINASDFDEEDGDADADWRRAGGIS